VAEEVALYRSLVEEGGLVQAVKVLLEEEGHAVMAQEELQVEAVELVEVVEAKALAAKPEEVGAQLLLEGRSLARVVQGYFEGGLVL